MADEVLHSGVRSVTDLIIMPGLINLDFADIKTVMSEMGKAMMGTGEASGEERAIKAAEAAIANPLLDHTSMSGAKGVLINITGGKDMTLYEVDSAANRIREEVGDSDANIIFGSTFNPELQGIIRVSVVATGIDSESINAARNERQELTTESKHIEEVENSLYHQEFSAEIEEIPEYESKNENESAIEFDNQEADLQEKIAKLSAQIDLESEQEAPKVQQTVAVSPSYKEQTVLAHKPSLLKRMWNSLKSAEANDESKSARVNNSPEDKKEHSLPSISRNSSDIQDIPAFLRKK
jgi:cell division protein FtsZ